MLSFVGIVVVWFVGTVVCFVLCQLSPFWPRILFGFRFLQSGIALFGIFLSIKFNSIHSWINIFIYPCVTAKCNRNRNITSARRSVLQVRCSAARLGKFWTMRLPVSPVIN